MNYLGSKRSLLPFLDESIRAIVGDRDFAFSDLFAGTGVVGAYMKSRGHRVIANDLQYYAYVLSRHAIGNHSPLPFAGLSGVVSGLSVCDVSERPEWVCQHLDGLAWEPWFIFKNYTLGGTRGTEHERLYFSDANAMRCDAIRATIERWHGEGLVTEDEYFFLLASLIESIDRVANTASVYGAFLKKLKKTALKSLTLQPARFFLNDHEHTVYHEDINTLARTTTHDVVYLDPPYNHRQYSGNYHILETIARGDCPTIRGVTGMRDCSEQRSQYCSRTDVLGAFRELIRTLDARSIFVSYNDEGLMSQDDIREIMSTRGEYRVFTREYGRFRADRDANRQYKKDGVIEYLHAVECVR